MIIDKKLVRVALMSHIMALRKRQKNHAETPQLAQALAESEAKTRDLLGALDVDGQLHFDQDGEEAFTKRDFEVIYAAFEWNPDVELIGCENPEFDEVMAKVQEAAGIEDSVAWRDAWIKKIKEES